MARQPAPSLKLQVSALKDRVEVLRKGVVDVMYFGCIPGCTQDPNDACACQYEIAKKALETFYAMRNLNSHDTNDTSTSKTWKRTTCPDCGEKFDGYVLVLSTWEPSRPNFT